MDALSWIAENRIREAVARGEFENLLGAGRPLELEDLSRVPEELRAGYILLKTHGVLPPDVDPQTGHLELRHLLAACLREGAPEDRDDRRRRTLLLEQLDQRSARLP